jgi:hypothetical protein
LRKAKALSQDKDSIMMPSDSLFRQALQAAISPGTPLADAVEGRQPPAYLPDAASLASAGATSWAFLPSSAQSLLVQPLLGVAPPSVNSREAAGSVQSNGDALAAGRGKMGLLLLWSDRPRALSQRERLWAAAMAAKLHDLTLKL